MIIARESFFVIFLFVFECLAFVWNLPVCSALCFVLGLVCGEFAYIKSIWIVDFEMFI